MVGSAYKPIQNEVMADFFKKFTAAGKMHMETAGSVRSTVPSSFCGERRTQTQGRECPFRTCFSYREGMRSAVMLVRKQPPKGAAVVRHRLAGSLHLETIDG
jgi:hypothetical protein